MRHARVVHPYQDQRETRDPRASPELGTPKASRGAQGRFFAGGFPSFLKGGTCETSEMVHVLGAECYCLSLSLSAL